MYDSKSCKCISTVNGLSDPFLLITFQRCMPLSLINVSSGRYCIFYGLISCFIGQPGVSDSVTTRAQNIDTKVRVTKYAAL